MPDITISPPALGTESYFQFKEPVMRYIQNKLNTSDSTILLKVIGINNLRSLIEAELRDPFVDTYNPMGITNTEYKQDVLNAVPLFVFSHTKPGGKVVYLKSPLSYIEDYSLTNDIVYTNRLIIIDLGKLPKELYIRTTFTDLKDIVYNQLGVAAEIKEVSVGAAETTTREDHSLREAIRVNIASVRKSNTTLLAEITHQYNQLISRLNELGITLG